MFYISSISVTPDIYILSNKMWLEARSRFVKKRLWLTKIIVTSFSFIGIKHDLIMSRQVLNALVRVSGKGNFNCQIYRLHNATYNSQ